MSEAYVSASKTTEYVASKYRSKHPLGIEDLQRVLEALDPTKVLEITLTIKEV